MSEDLVNSICVSNCIIPESHLTFFLSSFICKNELVESDDFQVSSWLWKANGISVDSFPIYLIGTKIHIYRLIWRDRWGAECEFMETFSFQQKVSD